MMDSNETVTPYLRMAYLYRHEELELSEIVKYYIIATSVGDVADSVDSLDLGYNVLDNSELHSALVYALLKHFPAGQTVTYGELGGILSLSQRQIGLAVNRLIKGEHLAKIDQGAAGAVYHFNVDHPLRLPEWVTQLTAALMQLSANTVTAERVAADCEKINFRRGFQVLREEIRRKFYARKDA